jgi:hypothetical protein
VCSCWLPEFRKAAGVYRLSTCVHEIVVLYFPPGHQVVVIEDVFPEMVGMVGTLFDIPLSFFALHWANPGKYLTGFAHVPLGQNLERHFVAIYPGPLHIDLIRRKGMP